MPRTCQAPTPAFADFSDHVMEPSHPPSSCGTGEALGPHEERDDEHDEHRDRREDPAEEVVRDLLKQPEREPADRRHRGWSPCRRAQQGRSRRNSATARLTTRRTAAVLRRSRPARRSCRQARSSPCEALAREGRARARRSCPPAIARKARPTNVWRKRYSSPTIVAMQARIGSQNFWSKYPGSIGMTRGNGTASVLK